MEIDLGYHHTITFCWEESREAGEWRVEKHKWKLTFFSMHHLDSANCASTMGPQKHSFIINQR